MDSEVPPRGMKREDLETMLNPLTPEELDTLRDVDAIVEATRNLMLRAEMAGVDVASQRAQLESDQQKARALLAAFGGDQG